MMIMSLALPQANLPKNNPNLCEAKVNLNPLFIMAMFPRQMARTRDDQSAQAALPRVTNAAQCLTLYARSASYSTLPPLPWNAVPPVAPPWTTHISFVVSGSCNIISVNKGRNTNKKKIGLQNKSSTVVPKSEHATNAVSEHAQSESAANAVFVRSMSFKCIKSVADAWLAIGYEITPV